MEYAQISIDLVNLFEMLDNPSKHGEIPAYVNKISKQIKLFKESIPKPVERDLGDLQESVRELREKISRQQAILTEYSLKNK